VKLLLKYKVLIFSLLILTIGIYRNAIIMCSISEDVIELNEGQSDDELSLKFNLDIHHPYTFSVFSISLLNIRKNQSFSIYQRNYKSPLLDKPLMPPEYKS
jgi:hypothetical protein